MDMKIYVREKDTIEKGGEYYLKTDTAIYINSLEQHDAEIRKQAKQEVVEELLRLIHTLGIIRKSKSFVNGYDFAQEQIKQKLNEMKEVK